jgi:hypothetical protein
MTLPSKQIDQKLEKIAQEKLGIDTLEQRWSDSLDFYDLSVWQVKEALLAAYEAGKSHS